jgi:hypothetical protein
MQPEKNSVTKSQVVYNFVHFNKHMQQYYPHAFDTRKFGWFIDDIRAMKTHEFETHKEELLNKLLFLNSCVDPNTYIFDMKKCFNS